MEIKKTFFVHAYFAENKFMTAPKEIPYLFGSNKILELILEAFYLKNYNPMDFKYFYETPSKECKYLFNF